MFAAEKIAGRFMDTPSSIPAHPKTTAATVSSTTSTMQQCQMAVSEQEQQQVPTSAPSSWLISLSNNAIAGCFAGAGARMVVAPLDLIRIRLQLEPNMTIWAHLQDVNRESGWKGFFRGNVPATYLWVGYSAIQFAVYARLSEALQQQSHLLSLPSSSHNNNNYKSAIAFVAGAMAGVTATVLTYPLDICRTNFAASQKAGGPMTMLGFARDMLRRQGLWGFWAGIVPSLYGIVPYMGFNFLIYETLVGEKTAFNAGVAGAISGSSSKLLVYPLDTVKKRLQVQAYESNHVRYQGTVDCLVQIVRHEGFGSLYRGILPSMLKNTIATSLSFSLYTLAQNALSSLTTTS